MSLEERLLEQARACDYGKWNMAAALLREAAEANRELVEGLREIENLGPATQEICSASMMADIARALIAKMEGR